MQEHSQNHCRKCKNNLGTVKTDLETAKIYVGTVKSFKAIVRLYTWITRMVKTIGITKNKAGPLRNVAKWTIIFEYLKKYRNSKKTISKELS